MAKPSPIPQVPVKLYSLEADDASCPLDVEGKKASWCAGKMGLYHFKTKTVTDLKDSRHFIVIDPRDFSELLTRCPLE